MKPIGKVLAEKAVSKSLWKSARVEHALAAWEELVGEMVARYSQPVEFRSQGGKGVLWLAVTDSAWSQELFLFRSELIRRLNNKAGMDVIEEIRIRVQPLPARMQRTAGPAGKNLTEPRIRRVVQDIQQHAKWRLENWPEG